MLTVKCLNNKTSIEVAPGSTLREVYDMLKLDLPYGACSAKVNNKVVALNYRIYNNRNVEFLNIESSSGMRTYTRTLLFILCKAVEDLYPGNSIVMRSTVSRGFYLTLKLERDIESIDVRQIKKRMRELIDADITFERHECPTEEAIALFEERGQKSKARLLKSLGKCYTNYYTLDGTPNYFYGSLLPSTGYIHLFELQKYNDGLLLRVPNKKNPSELENFTVQSKMFGIFQEYHKWQDLLGVSTVGDLNYACSLGHASGLITLSEALQEKKIAKIAETIAERGDVKVVLIAGPSSSGKTTFSKRLSVQLMANGIFPYPISLDDYFVDRTRTPRDENGDYDYESLYALDLDLFNRQMSQLMNGEEIELPRYDFPTGTNQPSGKKLKLKENQVLILEGIHALNPDLTPNLPNDNIFRIYVSALTTLKLDEHNYIPTTDNRLLRRIVRDSKYRNCSAIDTIQRWPSVRAGEDKWIFPYQENCDMMFNSALMFELAVFKNEALPLLDAVPENAPEYSEAYRLKKFLQYFNSVSSKDIPPTSLLREFLGGSSFEY